METKEAQALLESQAEIWQHLSAFADSMALKCAVELRIADIINSHGGPITLCQIAAGIVDSPSLDIPYLARIMRSLVFKKIFTAHNPSDGGDTLYGLTPASKWLLHDAELSLVPMVLMGSHPWLLAPWHCLSQCVKEGGTAFEKAHGCEMWDFASKNPDFNKIFNDGMACTAKFVVGAVLEVYKDGFGCLGSLVDVGGGTGGMIAENKLKDRTQQFEHHCAMLQQQVNELENKLTTEGRNQGFQMLQQKIKELEGQLKLQEQQESVLPVCCAEKLGVTPNETKSRIRVQVLQEMDPQSTRNLNSMNQTINQESVLLKGTDSLHKIRRRRELQSTGTENNILLSTPVLNKRILSTESKNARPIDQSRALTRLTRSTKSAATSHRILSSNKLYKDQVPGNKESNKSNIWLR